MKMNEEIEELLSIVSEGQDSIQLQEIKNYITNLQEELKEANESLTWRTNRFNAVERDNRELKQENQKLVKVFDELLEDSDMMLKSLNYNSKNGIEIVQYKLANIINKLTELKGGKVE